METISQVNNNVEEATRQLQLQSHVDSINEAIDVILSLVPAEETDTDGRVLRAIVSLRETRDFIQAQADAAVKELNQGLNNHQEV